MTYTIRLEQFEGPLDLLLSLIEDKKMDITRVSLAGVTEQYILFVKNNTSVTPLNMAEFISVAAKLILIKSKALLPVLELEEEEEAEIADLEEQLREYKKFQDASLRLGEIAQNGGLCVSRVAFLGVRSGFYPPDDLDVSTLRGAFSRVVADIPSIAQLDQQKWKDVVSLEQKMNHVAESVRQRVSMRFSDIVSQGATKLDTIVSFLAILELVRQQIVDVSQERHGEDIHIARVG
ncbi:MAG: segregation/condensation protein A [Candidatus Moranbacteria bacterium]|nr:segregation/condensation protein A [Candidatus Moranbacteria bacterium]